MHLLIVIPARIGSSRIPEKPLCLLNGEPLVRLVVRRALELELGGRIVVATDDQRVIDSVAVLGVEGVMTRGACRSGTERVGDVLKRPEHGRVDLVLNIQCDQPFLPAAAAHGSLEQVSAGFDIGTAAGRLASSDHRDPNRVKVLTDPSGRALIFSRHPIRRDQAGSRSGVGSAAHVHHHLGVYAYSRETLARWTALPPTAQERTQRLEQLRPLFNNMSIGVSVLDDTVDAGIDSLEDLARAREDRRLIY